MKKIYDAVVSTGKYTDGQGKEKNRYLTVGAVLQNDEGNLSLKLEAIPVVGFSGWINFYEPRPKETEKPARPQSTISELHDDADIPF